MESGYTFKRDLILECIKSYRLKNGNSPTVRELCELTDTKVSTMHGYLGRLRDEGEITWRPRGHRTIRLASWGARP